jgi:hypothetical protein
MQPQRRSYSKSFKAQVIQECAQLGASIASVALSHDLNANLVHKWIRLQSQKSAVLQPAFIPVALPSSASRSDITPAMICLEIPYSRGTIKVSWPTESAAACATFINCAARARSCSGVRRSRLGSEVMPSILPEQAKTHDRLIG